MKREEIADMMEQVKDEYIEETMPEEENREPKRRGISKNGIRLLAGAALALLCLGVSRLGGRIAPEEVSSAEAQQAETAGRSEVRESRGNSGREDREGKTEPVAEQKPAPETDYSVYFQGKPDEMIAADYTLEVGAGGRRYEFRGASAAEPLGFDTDNFSEIEATVYCDPDGKPGNLLLYLSSETDGQYLSLVSSEAGTLFSCFPVEETEGVDYQGTPVYGYHHAYPEHTSDPWSLELYFRKDGVGYSLSSTGMNYDEVGAVMAWIFASGFRPSSYDLSRGEECRRTVETISFAQAGEAFGGNVPALEQVAGMTLEEGCRYFVDYRGGQVEARLLDLCYSNSDAYLMVSYRSAPYGAELENVLPASEVNRESTARYGHENDDPQFLWYNFTIEYENYAVDITARCTEEMLWEYLEKLKK